MYGGRFIYGHGTISNVDPQLLVETGIIFVAFNYRSGPLGKEQFIYYFEWCFKINQNKHFRAWYISLACEGVSILSSFSGIIVNIKDRGLRFSRHGTVFKLNERHCRQISHCLLSFRPTVEIVNLLFMSIRLATYRTWVVCKWEL